jgi:hypothetical protein
MSGTHRFLSQAIRLGVLPWLCAAAATADEAAATAWRKQVEADWALQDAKRWPAGTTPAQQLANVIERGLRLAESLRELGVPVDAGEQLLRDLAQATNGRAGGASGEIPMPTGWDITATNRKESRRNSVSGGWIC